MTLRQPILAGGDRATPPTLCESPDYLRALADSFDRDDDERGFVGARNVQRDLRFWADEIERLCHA